MWLYFLAAFVAWKAAQWIWMRWKYDLHKIPSPPGLPFLGHTLYFTGGSDAPIPVYKHVNKWRHDLGNPKVMNLQLGSKTYLLVFDAAFTRDVILSKRDGLPKASSIAEDSKRILTADSDKLPFFATPQTTPYVKAIRRALTGCMNSVALEASMPRLKETLSRMMDVVERERERGPIDVEALFTRAALDNIGIFAFDFDFGALDRTKPHYECIIACGRHIRDILLRPLLKMQFKILPWMERCRQIQSDFDDLNNLWLEIATKIRERSTSSDREMKIWEVLKDFKDPETNEPLPVELLKGEVGTVVFGGMDSLGHTLSWTFALLATYPRVTEKIIDELKCHGLYGSEAREVVFADLASLEYITAVLKESMRLAYVNIFIARKCTAKDINVLGYRVPKGTHFFLPSHVMMQDEVEWETPNMFRPERWMTNEDVSGKYYFPFSNGARDCIGQRFAMTLMRWIMASFIARYSFEWSDKGTSFESLYASNISGMVVESRHGIRLRIERRYF